MESIEEIDSRIIDLIARRLELRLKNPEKESGHDHVMDMAIERGLDAGKIREIFMLLEEMAREKIDEMSGKTGVP